MGNSPHDGGTRMITSFGPGDPETWPAPTGHPNDPRTEDIRCIDCDEEMLDGSSCGCEVGGWC